MMNLTNYSGISVSISGGKDSQTILGLIADAVKEQNYGGRLIAIHADTGAEWAESLPHCRMLCEHYRIPLFVAVPFRALPDHIEKRCRELAIQGRKGGWPSSACRYCTSDCKRSPIQKVIRAEFPGLLGKSVLSVTGERREESSKRAKLPEFDSNKTLTTRTRLVTNWRPILDYKLPDVWRHIAGTGLPRHVAYDRGNDRLSCAMCVLATDNDIRNGAAAVPELAARFLQIEKDTGHTFKNGKSLAQILQGVTA
jgi:3'-phosphoadenosine 5'-phosphosulfate sulfotransferase (PAPS reductase)/FAD synthetase